MEYRRLTGEIVFSGKGLHTGEDCRVLLSRAVMRRIHVDGGWAACSSGTAHSRHGGGRKSSFPADSR
jgi:hypothetical protein